MNKRELIKMYVNDGFEKDEADLLAQAIIDEEAEKSRKENIGA